MVEQHSRQTEQPVEALRIWRSAVRFKGAKGLSSGLEQRRLAATEPHFPHFMFLFLVLSSSHPEGKFHSCSKGNP